MLVGINETEGRAPHRETLRADLTVAGGGLSGICAALAAAREGLKVILIQDRPVLGGNASSEVRLWILGATSHMGNNNRWSREGGIVDEILTENLYRNKEGNPVLLDALLMDKVLNEDNITLLLNTVVTDVHKKDARNISSLEAICPQTDTAYLIESPLFCDATGDGTVAFRSGASYRMGAEDNAEFSESFSASERFGELLGHSMYFYTKKCDHPVTFVAPDFALKDISVIPKFENIRPDQWGCNYWWFEYGGELDTIHDSDKIRTELMKIIYGAWNYIKNSGKFPEAENLTLEWVGTIPGKRESRRFEGLYMINQKDIVEQHTFDDAVAYGGWAVDLHPAAGVYSPLPSCTQYHSKGIYPIPYRCYVSKDIDNLFLAGRIISASHIAFGSTRVMATAGAGGQAVGTAAALCRKYSCKPSDILAPEKMSELQNMLDLCGQSIPGTSISPESNLASSASLRASSELQLGVLPLNGDWLSLEYGAAQILPLRAGTRYSFKIRARASRSTELDARLMISSKPGNFTPDVTVSSKKLSLAEGEQDVELIFADTMEKSSYAFVMFRANPDVSLALSDLRVSGILSVFNRFNLKVGNRGRQVPPEGSGFEAFEFWCPERRPQGKNIAMSISPALDFFGAGNVLDGHTRPGVLPGAWAGAIDDAAPELSLSWTSPRKVSRVLLFLDNDFDHAMESVQYGHPEDVVPFCVRKLRVETPDGEVLKRVESNHSTIISFVPEQPVSLSGLKIILEKPDENVPAALFQIYID